MKDKQILKAAVATYVKEVANNLFAINYLYKNIAFFKTHRSLLENKEDLKVYKEIFGFGKSKPISVLSADEKAVSKVLKNRIEQASKEIPKLAKTTNLSDPTAVGISLQQIVDKIASVEQASEEFNKMYTEVEEEGRKELEKDVATLMPAKMALYSLVALKLHQLEDDAKSALTKMKRIVPDNIFAAALKSAQKDYVPPLPMRSAIDQITGRDLPDTTIKPMRIPGSMSLRENETVETPWQDAEPEKQ